MITKAQVAGCLAGWDVQWPSKREATDNPPDFFQLGLCLETNELSVIRNSAQLNDICVRYNKTMAAAVWDALAARDPNKPGAYQCQAHHACSLAATSHNTSGIGHARTAYSSRVYFRSV